MNLKMRALFGALALFVSLVSFVGATSDETTLSVMSRNQYLGGDLLTVATAPDVPTFLAAARAVLTDIAISNFPERAQAFAREIAERRPDIIGLQEVFNFKLNGLNGAPPFVDQLDATLDALAAVGLNYIVVASVQNFDATVPVDLDGDGIPESLVDVTDRDVILARADLAGVTPVPLSSFCPRPSADGGPGCNYSTFLTVNLPVGQIQFHRGFVAVDVNVQGTVYRVVNTHLEVENLDPSNPLSPLIQSAQATELKSVLEAISAGTRLIVVGDINSTSEDPLFPDPEVGPFVRPYQQLAEGVNLVGTPTAGGPYGDTWILRPGAPAGYTCCEPDLFSSVFNVHERKDVVFSRSLPGGVKANVFGHEPESKTSSGLWPSDHAGLFVRFRF